MEDSILKTVKKILGVPESYTVFDLDIITHINSVCSILGQLGVGPEEGIFIEDAIDTWDDYFSGQDLNLIRSYVFLRVKLLFDPPSMSYLYEAMTKQIQEFEFRISTQREWNLNPVDPMEAA